MKRFQVSEDIYPLGEFKSHASSVIRKLRASRRAAVITQNGRPAAVLITPEEFDRLCEREQFIEAVERGLADSEAGRSIDDERMRSLLDEEFGPLGRR